jgi:hypothetical protein
MKGKKIQQDDKVICPIKNIFKPGAGGSWLILATQEAEISWTAIQSQPWANSLQDPTLKKPNTK